MTPLCMTPDELHLWHEANSKLTQPASTPCMDCDPSWCQAMRLIGRCNGEPEAPIQDSGLTRASRASHLRRESNRQAQQRWRARNPGRRKRPADTVSFGAASI